MSHADSSLVLVGWDFRQTPVEIREQIAFSPDKVKEALNAMKNEGLLSEGVILSTCNRSEIYGVAGGALNEQDPLEAIVTFTARYHGVPRERIEGVGYRHAGPEAVRHLLRVAAGLESLALGEDQILGQVREAFRVSTAAGGVKSVLHRLFQKAVETGKRVRSETGLSSRPISIPGVAIELAQKIYEDLASKHFLILGAGETSGIFYDLLMARGARQIVVANRTLSRAEDLCKRGGKAVAWDQLDSELMKADILVSAVSTPQPVLTREMAKKAVHERRGKPLFFLDLGIPRNVEPSVGDIDGAFLYAVDDLQEIAERNRQERQKEIVPAQAILEEELDEYIAWLNSLAVIPTMTALRQKFETIREAEFDEQLQRMSHLPEKDREKIRLMAQSMVRSLLRHPTEALKQEPDPGRRLVRAEAIAHLFDLSVKPKD